MRKKNSYKASPSIYTAIYVAHFLTEVLPVTKKQADKRHDKVVGTISADLTPPLLTLAF
jgi:hypothetical protein